MKVQIFPGTLFCENSIAVMRFLAKEDQVGPTPISRSIFLTKEENML